MRLFGHLVAFDFRAQRLLLAVWAAALVAESVSFATGHGSTPFGQPGFGWAYTMMFVRGGIMLAVVSQSIHADAPVGTHGFWLTRPIPPLGMMAAKLLPLIVWIVVAPAALTCATLFALGMTSAGSLTAARTVAFEQSFALAVTMMAAVVTANLAQLVVAGIAGFTTVTLLNAIVLPAVSITWPEVGSTVGGWQPTVYAACVAVGALLTTWHQYMRRRSWVSLALVGITLFFAGVATEWWGRTQALPSGTTVADAELRTSKASFIATDQAATRFDTIPGSDAQSGTTRLVLLEARPSGMPDDVALWPLAVRSELTIPGRAPIRWAGRASPRVSHDQVPDGLPTGSAVAAVKADTKFPWPAVGGLYMTVIGALSAADYDAARAHAPSLSAEITCDAYRYRLAGRLPVTPGARVSIGRRAIVIGNVEVVESGLHVYLRDTVVSDGGNRSNSPISTVFVLRNTVLNEGLVAAWATWNPQGLTMGFASTSVLNRQLKLVGPIKNMEHQDVTPTQWLTNAELLLLEPEPLGLVTLPLRVDRLTLPTPPPVRR